jgi:hypothetical protein
MDFLPAGSTKGAGSGPRPLASIHPATVDALLRKLNCFFGRYCGRCVEESMLCGGHGSLDLFSVKSLGGILLRELKPVKGGFNCALARQ